MSRDGAVVDVAALAADVARQGEAIRRLVTYLISPPDGTDISPLNRGPGTHILAALAVPAPDTATPPPSLPGPVADALKWMRSMAATFPNVDGTPPPAADALAAWARALPPALDAEKDKGDVL